LSKPLNLRPATTIPGVQTNEVLSGLDSETGEMKYYRHGKELPLEDGFNFSIGKGKPFDKSGLGVFSGFGEGTLNQALKKKLKESES